MKQIHWCTQSAQIKQGPYLEIDIHQTLKLDNVTSDYILR